MPPRNLGRTNKAATTKRQLPKGPYGPQTQTATSGWGRGFSTQRIAKSRLQRYGMVGMVWYGIAHPTPPHPTPSHPIPHPTPPTHPSHPTPPHPTHTPPHPIPPHPTHTPPQARGDAVLIPSNAVGDAWVRRALLKVRVATCYLLPTSHCSSHATCYLLRIAASYYLLLRVVSLSRLCCLRSSSCRSITRLPNVRHVRVLPSEPLRGPAPLLAGSAHRVKSEVH